MCVSVCGVVKSQIQYFRWLKKKDGEDLETYKIRSFTMDKKQKHNTFAFAAVFHELDSKM